MSSTQLPLEYLVTSSKHCLEGFELARLNQISNLRKEFSQVYDELIEAEIAARMARWILNGRRTQDDGASVDQIVSARPSSPEVPSSASKTRQLPLPRDDPKSGRGGRTASSLFHVCRICSAPEMPADSNREVRTPPEHESEPGARSSPVSADAAAAVESLEKSAASNVQSIGYGGGRANGVQHNSHQYTPMLPFPEAGVLLFHADIATRGRPSPSHRRARRCSEGGECPKILSLPLARPDAPTCVAQTRERGRVSATRGQSLTVSIRGILRPFPSVRAPLRKHLVYGNVALSES